MTEPVAPLPDVRPPRASWRRRLGSIDLKHQLGPGLVTGAADDDPSGIATYSQAGAQFGYTLLWTMPFCFPLMAAIQLISARIGRVSGQGLALNLKKVLPAWAVLLLVVLLFVANTINIGADLAAMGDALEMTAGINAHAGTVGFALLSLLLQLFVPYKRYSSWLKWLTVVLVAYIAVALMVRLDGHALLKGLTVPIIPGKDAVVTIVALFGTTISPYLFFWQSSQEVEEIGATPAARALNEAPWQARKEMRRMRIDTIAGMAASNIIALAIMVATAATLHARGQTDIQTAADAAKALEPVAGQLASLIFTLGIIGTGLLAVPVLAGSAGYAVAELRGWKASLDYKPRQAFGFYSVIIVATLIGVAIDWSTLDPIKALFWSAVINGVAAVPIMAAMMLVISRSGVMGKFTASRPLLILGWLATLVMAVAALAMVIL